MKTSSETDDSEYYIASPIKLQLDKGSKALRKADQDRVIIITGAEGSGKSLLAMQLATYVDPKFSIEDICFDGDTFAKRIREKERYGAVIFDEAFNGLSSRGAISNQNKKLIRLLQECRQRNLWVFIVLPSIFLLEKYVALFRSQVLFNTAIYRKDYTKRYYKCYNRKNKKLLYLLGYKLMSYSQPRIHKKYRFYGKYPSNIDEQEYREKKAKSFREGEKRDTKEDKWRIQRNVVITMAHKIHKIPYVEIARWLKAYSYPLEPTVMGRLEPKKPENTPNFETSI